MTLPTITVPKIEITTEQVPAQIKTWLMVFGDAGIIPRMEILLSSKDTEGKWRTDITSLMGYVSDVPESIAADGTVVLAASNPASNLMNVLLSCTLPASDNVKALETVTGLTLVGKTIQEVGLELISILGSVGPV